MLRSFRPKASIDNITPVTPQVRVAAFAVVFLATLLIASAITPARQTADDPCTPKPGCFVFPQRDISFLVDTSGSIAQHGQAYNSTIEGLIRAVKDPTTFPRNGSTAVSVVVFNGAATVAVSLTDVTSEAIAQDIASTLETLKCSDIKTPVFPCPFGQTSYTAGIKAADGDVSKKRALNPKPGAIRTFVLITDGHPEDPDFGVTAAEQARNASLQLGIPFEFNAILVTLDPATDEFQVAKSIVDQLVFPAPTTDLPGATLVIPPGDCDVDGATFGPDCSRQANQLAELSRRIIQGPVPSVSFTVTTESDTNPNTAVIQGGPVSLRQAIEQANCNGGSAKISFADAVRGKTITLTSPLPPLSAPDIGIDGCGGADCTPAVTLDGGGSINNGLALRSGRDTVRGLHLKNFARAAVAIEPLCLNDSVGHNIVELNVLENSPSGVIVSETIPQRIAPSKVAEVSDGANTRNKISKNTITRNAPGPDAAPAALIDLGADGPTPNDDGDTDTGPNGLLNFPDSLSAVAAAGGTVKLSGKLNSPPVDGSTVEIYAVTRLRTVESDIVIDGVAYLATATVADDGTFVVEGVTPSPSGVYTALVIDNSGAGSLDGSANTSELMFDSANTRLPRSNATASATIPFGSANIGTPVSKPVDVSNTGTAPLIITGCSIGRCPGANSDNRTQFSIIGCPTVPVNPGSTVTITVTFNATACGPANACLLLQTNDPFKPQVAIQLTATATAPGRAVLQGSDTFTFKRRAAHGAPVANPRSITFAVSNPGCQALSIPTARFTRGGALDTSGVFSVVVDGTQGGFPATIPSQGSVTFRVFFNPVIPAVVQSGSPGVKDVLPDNFTDQLTLQPSAGDPVVVNLNGRVKRGLIVIDPHNPANPPIVTLCRSGNEFIVEFSEYDANLNPSLTTYQFLDGSGKNVGNPINVDLAQAVSSRNLLKGQSFTVTQRFTGANDNDDVRFVDITIRDGEGSTTVRSSQLGTSCSSSLAAPAGQSLHVTSMGIRPIEYEIIGERLGGYRVKLMRSDPLVRGSVSNASH